MFDIWTSIAELQQPCLYRALGERLIGPDGLVRREILTSLDRLFCEHLAAGRASFQMPAAPAPIPPEQRFLNISALQKSIRFGDVEGAMRYAQQGCMLNAEQVFRRLAVCAVEDVGIGNLLAVGMALAVMGNRAMRENGAPDELAAYLASILAGSVKSRLACDLLSIADYDRELAPTKERLAKMPAEQQATVATNRFRPLPERMAAAWLLAGTSKFPGAAMPHASGDRHSLLLLLAQRRVPLIFYYIADRTASRLRDAMFVAWLFVAELVNAEPQVTIVREQLGNQQLITGYPAAAFDLHTTEGRLALSRFARSCPAIVRCVAELSPTLRDTAIRYGVFIAEGGRLAERLSFTAADEIRLAAHEAELAFAGLDTPDGQTAIIAAIIDNVDRLNILRRNVRS